MVPHSGTNHSVSTGGLRAIFPVTAINSIGHKQHKLPWDHIPEPICPQGSSGAHRLDRLHNMNRFTIRLKYYMLDL